MWCNHDGDDPLGTRNLTPARKRVAALLLICPLATNPVRGQAAQVPEALAATQPTSPQPTGDQQDSQARETVPSPQPRESLLYPFRDYPDPRRHMDVVDISKVEGAVPDDCTWQFHDRPIQEGTRDAVRGMSCYTFRWFDSLFGHTQDFPEDQVSGLVTLGAEYSRYFGFDPRLRMRVRAPLPNANHRWDLILGRVDEQAYISDTQAQDRTFYNPGIINREQEAQWMLGLGNRRRGGESGWDWSAGVRLRFPLIPYAKTAWRYYHSYSPRSDLRFRQTFFWRKDDGFGTTSRGDLAWSVDPENVLRWEGSATVSEATDGAEVYVGQTWYHLLGEQRAFSLRGFAVGETNADVPVREYGFNFTWRRPFTRDWMFLSIGPSITWPRMSLDEKREASLGFGVWIEMEFGNWRY